MSGGRVVPGKQDLCLPDKAGSEVPRGPRQPGLHICPVPQALLFRPGIPRRWHSALELRAQTTDGEAGLWRIDLREQRGAFSSSSLPWSLISCPPSVDPFPPPFPLVSPSFSAFSPITAIAYKAALCPVASSDWVGPRCPGSSLL